MEMELAGKVIKPEESKKSLGLLISENLNCTGQVNATMRKCKFKLRSLKRLKDVVTYRSSEQGTKDRSGSATEDAE